ncbi:MAG: FAD:protein FMN transferase, partial [bacterium]
RGNTMGTTYSVKTAAGAEEGALEAEIKTRLQKINNLMSTYLPDSELSRFNQSPVGEPFELSAETRRVLEMAIQVNQMSNGKFDVTVGPLVNLWGFGPESGDQTVPTEEEIETALTRVGMDKLHLKGNYITKSINTYVDLSAIAKGFGVDEIAAILDARGIEDYLVEIGGELRAHGLNDRGQPWRIAVEKPDVFQRAPFKAIDVRNQAMATSGDYRNFFEVKERRYSHTLDPTTGYPVDHNVASVTVLTTETAMADGLATAINVMGVEAGLTMAEQHNLAVLVIINTEDGFAERHSSAFATYLRRE